MAVGQLPQVTVLLATYNGVEWLDEQLDSIFEQSDVHVKIVASDDQSSDGTLGKLEQRAQRDIITILPRHDRRFGNANRNFLHLVREAQVDGGEYVAFSDQDDIWLPGKLRRAVDTLHRTGTAVYTCDVRAFWPNGRQERSYKAGRLREFDHLFEAGGGGNTLVMRLETFQRLRSWVRDNAEALDHAPVQDWLIYAFCRENGVAWTIDPFVGVLYRQHAENEVGANIGLKAALRRLKTVRSGAYRQQVLWIAEAVNHRSNMIGRLRRLTWKDRLYLAVNSRKMRRAPRDVVALAIGFLIMKPTPEG